MNGKKFWGESPLLHPVKQFQIGDVVLARFSRAYYSLGWIVSSEINHKNIFGEYIEGILTSDESDHLASSAVVMIFDLAQLRQNDETISMNRDRKINLLLGEEVGL